MPELRPLAQVMANDHIPFLPADRMVLQNSLRSALDYGINRTSLRFVGAAGRTGLRPGRKTTSGISLPPYFTGVRHGSLDRLRYRLGGRRPKWDWKQRGRSPAQEARSDRADHRGDERTFRLS